MEEPDAGRRRGDDRAATAKNDAAIDNRMVKV
jgi:hypothetical protein